MSPVRLKSKFSRSLILLILIGSLGLNAFFFTSFGREFKNDIKNRLYSLGLYRPGAGQGYESFAYYAYLDSTFLLPESSGKSAQALPSSLIIAKGVYEFNGKTYDLQKEGLYRFIHPLNENQQRLVFEDDVYALLSGLSWIASHGGEDDGKSDATLENKALDTKLYLTCNYISNWASRKLKERGVESRRVSLLTITDQNGYSDGHALLEVFLKESNKWVLFDLDMNRYFRSDSSHLSLYEMMPRFASKNYEIVPLSSDIKTDVSGFTSNAPYYEFAFINERTNTDPKTWYQRLARTMTVWEGDDYYHFDIENRPLLEANSGQFKYLPREKFVERFYNGMKP